MKKSLIILLLLLGCGVVRGEEDEPTYLKFGNKPIIEEYLKHEPPPSLTFFHEGKQAILDFSGDEIIYEGDLPVAESAKIFFDYLFGEYKREFK